MRRRIVKGHGPAPCEFMLVGSAPGWEEDRDGIPFVGKTGDELDRYLDGASIPTRQDIFLANIYNFFGGKDYTYTTEDYEQGTAALRINLMRVQPKIIITLGREAARFFLGDVDMDDVHSMPWIANVCADCGAPEPSCHCSEDPFRFLAVTVFPIYHVAAGFHNPEISGYVSYGFEQLAHFLDGDLEARRMYEDEFEGKEHYEEITTVDRLREVIADATRGAAETGRVAIDTEGWPGAAWSLQFSFQPGVAYLIRASRRDLFDAFGEYLNLLRPRVTYHNALHDLAMMHELGLPTDLPFDDTMVMSYLLQIEPRGLKPLCVRHCNMRMQSYDDVLGDASHRLALDYTEALWGIEQLDWEARREDAFWIEIDKGRRISKFPKLPKTPLHKATERILRSKDARKLWGNQVDDIQVAAYNRLGALPAPTLDYVPRATAVTYGARDADGTTRLRGELESRLTTMGLSDVYRLELSTYPLIERMHRVGIRPNLDHFAALSTRLASELTRLKSELADTIGRPGFNANSGDQVADYLFDGLGLEGFKRVSSGRFSTNDKVLEALEHEHPEHPIIGTIREYRETYKLKNTFVDRLPDFVRRYPFDGRIHTTFRTTSVVTGRLAASDPNLLAMPKHGKFAKDFRRGWQPEPGHLFGEWDLSQIELRVLAHLSQDPVMLAIFRGEMRNPDGSQIDLHAALAQRIFGVAPKDQDKSKHRLPAKAVNFGIPMGMTAKGLMVELRKNGVMVSEEDAQEWLDSTLELYKGVAVYMEERKAEARRAGYVRCLSGRIRYIGGIRSPHENVRSEAERFAFSTPIQEGAQWVMKQAESRLYDDILVPYWRQGVWVEPLIQIHDALTLEFTDSQELARELNEQMVANMTTTPAGFSVPIETSGDWGYNWSDMEAF